MSDANDATVETLLLPLSGFRLQWRPDDGLWREIDPHQWADEELGHFTPTPQEWGRAPGGSCQLRMQARPGDLPEPTWWLLYGERPMGATVQVRLADGHTPLVQVLGQVWGCEWISLYQQAMVTLGDRDLTMPPIERLARREPFIGPTQGWASLALSSPPDPVDPPHNPEQLPHR